MSHIVINEDQCKGCELCTTVCPQGDLVQMADYFNVKGYRPSVYVDPEGKCTGCTLCAIMCPDMVISVYRTVRKKRRVPRNGPEFARVTSPGKDEPL